MQERKLPSIPVAVLPIEQISTAAFILFLIGTIIGSWIERGLILTSIGPPEAMERILNVAAEFRKQHFPTG